MVVAAEVAEHFLSRGDSYGSNETRSKAEGRLRTPLPSDDHNERPIK